MAKKRAKRVSSKSRKVSRKVSRKPQRSLQYKKRVPGLVKAISVLFYVAAVFAILAGLILFVGGIIGSSATQSLGIEDLVKSNALDPVFVPIVLGSLIIIGLIMVVFGVLHIFIGLGLWRGKQWARILAIILFAIGFITSIFTVDFVSLIITGLVGGYLAFSPTVRKSFGN